MIKRKAATPEKGSKDESKEGPGHKIELLESHESMDDQFFKLSIEDFVASRELQNEVLGNSSEDLNYPLYLRLSELKYVKIANRGVDLPLERLRGYNKKGTQHLYLRKEDFHRYMGLNLDLSRATQKSSTVSREKKLGLLKHTNEIVLGNLYANEVDAKMFESARAAVEAATTALSDFDEAYNLLDILNKHTDYLFARSVAVSFYSAMIAKQLNWNSPATLFKIAVAGLLHDIGKKEIDRAILYKPRMHLTPAEIKMIESHPVRSAEILSKIPTIPGEVIQIVLQHHENCLGAGYPVGLKKNQIHPVARLLSVADHFSCFVLRGPEGPGIPPAQAFEKILSMYLDALDPTFLLPLMTIFHYSVPKEYLVFEKKWKVA